MFFQMGHFFFFFFCLRAPVSSKGQRLRYTPGQGNPGHYLCCCTWGDGSEREQWCLLSFTNFLSLLPLPTSELSPSGADFPGGWVCVLSRTSWVSPGNSPVRLGLSPTTSTPTRVFNQRFEPFSPLHWNPGLCGLSRFPVVPPSLSAGKCGTAYSTSCHLSQSASYRLTCSTSFCLVVSPLCPAAPSAPPTGLAECFFFNSLVVRLPYSSISWQFCYFLFLNLLLSFFWLCKEAQCVYLHLHLGWKTIFVFLSAAFTVQLVFMFITA